MGTDYKYLINEYIDLRKLHNENYRTAVNNHDFIGMIKSYVYINYENNSKQNLKPDDIHKYLSTYTDLDYYADKLCNELKQYNKDEMHVLNESCELIDYGYDCGKYISIIENMIYSKSLSMKCIDSLYDKIMESIIETTDDTTAVNDADKISFILNNEWFYDKLCFSSDNSSRIIIHNRQKTAVKTLMALYDERGASYCSHIIDKNNSVNQMKDYNLALYHANGDVNKYDNIIRVMFTDEMKPFREMLFDFNNPNGYISRVFKHARDVLSMYNGDLTMNTTLTDIIRNDEKLNSDFKYGDKISDVLTDDSISIVSKLWEQATIDNDEALIADISAFMVALFIKSDLARNNANAYNNDDIINHANNYDKYTVEYADECLKMAYSSYPLNFLQFGF